MNDLAIFQNDDFGSVRTVEQDGKVMFCGKDIAEALGYARPADAISTHCKGVCVLPTPSAGGQQQTKFIPEGDVYRLITHSKLPSAEKFEHWVFDEVIPAIRRSGSYSLPNAYAQQVAYLNSLRARLSEWKEYESKFSVYTSNARKDYLSCRKSRDECRANVAATERQIDAAIAKLALLA